MSNLCGCGCGQETKPGNKYIHGHNKAHKGMKHSAISKLKMSMNNINFYQGKKLSAEHKHNISIGNTGKKRTEETKLKHTIIHTGKKHSSDHIHSISISLKNRKLSEEHKTNIRIGTIKRIERQKLNNQPLYPSQGMHEKPILDKIQEYCKYTILRNDHDIAMKVGKFPDGYIKELNLCLDVLEKHHYKPNGELIDYDHDRQSILACELGCMVYYIPEQEFLSNPRKEIDRFNGFIELLRN